MTDPEQREVTPYTIAESYHRGELTRDEVIQQLIEYDYLPEDDIPDDPTGDVGIYVDGSWDDMGAAYRERLIDAEIYETVLAAVRKRENSRRPSGPQ